MGTPPNVITIIITLGYDNYTYIENSVVKERIYFRKLGSYYHALTVC
jgi:hypothetical protein